MKTMQELIAELPAEITAGAYSSLSISFDHFTRLVRQHEADENWLRFKPDMTPRKFAGLEVRPDPYIPDGIGVAMREGKPIGVINFTDGTATFVKS